MAAYDLQILDGVGWANGINASGEVVGITFNALGSDSYGTWWVPNLPNGSTYTRTQGNPEQLFKVNAAGDAVGYIGPVVWDTNANASIATLPSDLVQWDINDAYQVLGSNGLVYDWQNGVSTSLHSLPGQSQIWCGGINNHGDVVGASGDQGFLYSSGIMLPVDGCNLMDINDGQLAVGVSTGTAVPVPVYIDLSQSNPLAQIPLPPEGSAPPGFTGNSYAVNKGGAIVGAAANGSRPFFSYAFVYQFGATAAADLNTLVPPGSPYLTDALDINGAGQIVGTAWVDDEQLWAPYVATPRTVPNFVGLSEMLGLVTAVLGGTAVDGGGGPVQPYGPVTWSALPLTQRQALLSFAISDLADVMTDREARTQIQNIAAEAAARAVQGRRPHGARLSPALKERMAKARKRLLRR